MLKVTNTTRGTTVGEGIELADTSMKRMFGLLGRRGLDAGGGLWIKPSSGVHTFGMAFKIDVVGLDRDLKVIKLWRCLAPFRVTSVSLKMKVSWNYLAELSRSPKCNWVIKCRLPPFRNSFVSRLVP